MTIDCGRFAANLEEHWRSGPRRRICRSARARRRRAAGCAGSASPAFSKRRAARPSERAEIRFEPDGRVALILGTQSNGQGHETSYPQIAADLLGLPLESFRLVQADTRSGQERRRAWRRALDASWAARRWTRRRRWSSPRAARSPPICCRPTLPKSRFADGRFTVGGGERGIDLLAVAARPRPTRPTCRTA